MGLSGPNMQLVHSGFNVGEKCQYRIVKINVCVMNSMKLVIQLHLFHEKRLQTIL